MYRLLRDLHLYFGLFVSPFVLLFAVSVFYLNHGVFVPGTPRVERRDNLRIPDGVEGKGTAAIAPVRALMSQLGISGEIGFVRYVAATRHVFFPVTTAGFETTVDVDLEARSAIVTRRQASFLDRVAYLHKMPGPHNAAIRGNSAGMIAWRWLADATVYLLLFISITGVYLWWALRAERTAGVVLLAAGGLTLTGLVYAIVR